jgi:hypothetical protein
VACIAADASKSHVRGTRAPREVAPAVVRYKKSRTWKAYKYVAEVGALPAGIGRKASSWRSSSFIVALRAMRTWVADALV